MFYGREIGILGIFQNRILICAVISWLTAQLVKVFIHFLVTRQFDITRLWGDGGMPSAHSATVSGAAAASGFLYGFDSAIFGVAFILAAVVMHDAHGVRRETGKQTAMLKEIAHFFEANGNTLTFEETLKEFVGHTPLQVGFGCLIGVAVAFVFTL